MTPTRMPEGSGDWNGLPRTTPAMARPSKQEDQALSESSDSKQTEPLGKREYGQEALNHANG